MSARRPSIYWPAQLTLWAAVAAFYATGRGYWWVVVCAVLTVAFSWLSWLFERAEATR